MAKLPEFKCFEIVDDQISATHWTKWISRFNYFPVAINITDVDWQVATLLHYEGEEVNDIYHNLIKVPRMIGQNATGENITEN